MTERERNLEAALTALLAAPTDTAIQRTARMILGTPADARDCPVCKKSLAVKKGEVTVHFSKNEDTKPCPASFKTLTAKGELK